MARSDLLQIDGSYGEGGGQILRSALALSAILSQPVRIFHIRAGRKNPGLARQRLAAVQVVAQICGAETVGATVGSQELVFRPGGMTQPGRYDLDIGTAGAATLVIQTILWPLALVAGSSQVVVRGGTHVPWSPIFQYLQQVYLPVLAPCLAAAAVDPASRDSGAQLPQLTLDQWGWYPKGGGQISLHLAGPLQIQPHSWQEPGRLHRIRGLSAASQLPVHVAERQRVRALEWFKGSAQPLIAAGVPVEIEVALPEALSPGSILFLVGEYERVRTGFSHLGERGLPAEQVAISACRGFEQHHALGMAIDPHLADQLLLPMALAGGDSHFTTSNITQHCLTNAWLMQRFLPLQVIVEGQLGQKGTIRIHV